MEPNDGDFQANGNTEIPETIIPVSLTPEQEQVQDPALSKQQEFVQESQYNSAESGAVQQVGGYQPEVMGTQTHGYAPTTPYNDQTVNTPVSGNNVTTEETAKRSGTHWGCIVLYYVGAVLTFLLLLILFVIVVYFLIFAVMFHTHSSSISLDVAIPTFIIGILTLCCIPPLAILVWFFPTRPLASSILQLVHCCAAFCGAITGCLSLVFISGLSELALINYFLSGGFISILSVICASICLITHFVYFVVLRIITAQRQKELGHQEQQFQQKLQQMQEQNQQQLQQQQQQQQQQPQQPQQFQQV